MRRVHPPGSARDAAPGPADPHAAPLAARVAEGSQEAEAELVERYRPGLLLMLRHALDRGGPAEDLCQEALRIAIENLRKGALHEPRSLPAYLVGIARNLARRERRNAWRRAPLLPAEPGPPDPAASAEAVLEEKERAGLVRFVLAGLSPRDRQVLGDFYLRGVGKAELCERLGLEPGQFDVVKFRALKRFARLWEARGRE